MKSGRLAVWGLLCCALCAGLLSLAALTAMVMALTVTTTLAAIESAFGSFIIAIFCFVLARRSWRGAMRRRQGASQADSAAEEKSGQSRMMDL